MLGISDTAAVAVAVAVEAGTVSPSVDRNMPDRKDVQLDMENTDDVSESASSGAWQSPSYATLS